MIVLLLIILMVATLGEGGAQPSVLLVSHLLIAAAFLVSRSVRRHRTLDSGLSFGILLSGVAIAIGASLAPYAYGAWLTVLEWIAFFAMMHLAATVGPAAIERAAPALMIAAAAQGLYGIWQWAGEGVDRPAATFLNTNHLAAWLGVIAILGLGLARDRRSLAIRGALALPIGVAFLLTGSRGAMLGLLAAIAYLLLRRWNGLSGRTRRVVVAVALVGVGFLAFRQFQRFQDPDPYRHHRTKIWKASVTPALEKPWTGTGPRQFATEAANLNFPDGRGPLRFDRSFRSTHSDLLRPIAELGWPTALLMLATLLYGAGRVRRTPRELDLVREISVAAGIALGTQALVDNLSERPAVYLLFAFIAGAMLSTERTARSPRLGVNLALAALLGVWLWVVDIAPYRAWQLQQRAAVAADETVSALLERSLELNPIHAESWRLRAEALTRGDRFDTDIYGEARASAEAAIRLDPAAARHRRSAARVEAAACRRLFRDQASRSRARTRFLEAEARARYDPIIPLELAAFLLGTGDPLGARRATERALTLEPNGVRSRLLLAEALLAVGGADAPDRARELLAEARDLSRQWSKHATRNTYSERLLGFDPDAARRIERQLR